ncbi:MAG: cytochrome C [Betaproteobacteria bacterium]|nr:cytochrome C [Betaproteobacteria bacterium]
MNGIYGKSLVRGLLAVATLVGVTAAASAAPVSDPQLAKVVAHGKTLFTQSKFDGNGRVCQSCHLGGGLEPGRRPDGKPIPSLANAAAVFPRYKERAGRVFTLADQVRACIGGALEGKDPGEGSEDVTALVVYLTSLSQGKAIDMGGKPQ